MSSKIYSWLEEGRKSQESLEQEVSINDLSSIGKQYFSMSLEIEEFKTSGQSKSS